MQPATPGSARSLTSGSPCWAELFSLPPTPPAQLQPAVSGAQQHQVQVRSKQSR